MTCRAEVASLVALLLLAVLPRTLAAAPITVRDPGTNVVDQANVINSSTYHRMEDALADLRTRTGAEVKVLTVPTTGGEDISDFAQRHAELWKLGKKKENNGALIVLALKEHKVKIQTGYGLEGALPDSWCGSTSRVIAAQYFKPGNYAAGLEELTKAVIAKINGEQVQAAPVDLPPASLLRKILVTFFMLIWPFLPFLIFIVIAVLANRNPRARGWINGPVMGQILSGVANSGRSSSGSWAGNSGGWSGSSGGGGFDGGGSFGSGGSFGGGGGGASW